MKPHYEGWYMKQQCGDDVLAVIPGRAQDNAFIQVITPNGAQYVPYPLSSFAQNKEGMIIGESVFTLLGIDACVHGEGVDLEGRLRYRNRTPLGYDIMGPFSLLPMETKHTVFSMRHDVEGSVVLNGVEHRFDGGVGYMEGDRGHSFPRGYTWVQSVDFDRGASVMLAIAEIPLVGLRFTGCIGVVNLPEREYRFATYLGVRIVRSEPTCVELVQRGLRLQVELLDSEGHALQAPQAGSMQRVIKESPAVPVRFLFERNGLTLLDAVSERTSVEYVPA